MRRRDVSGKGGRGEPEGAGVSSAQQLRRRARRRLIGAAALLLAVVVVVPLLLDKAPRPVADNIPIDIPGERTPFTPRLALPPLAPPPEGAGGPMPPADAPDTAPDAAPSQGAAAAPGSPSEPAPETKAGAAPPRTATKAEGQASGPATVQKGKPEHVAAASAAAAADEKRAKDLLEGHDSAREHASAVRPWKIVVQVAALGSETAARELGDRLRGAGFAPYTERTDTSEGTRFRVRVGPYPSRDDAERARARLRALGVGSTVVAP